MESDSARQLDVYSILGVDGTPIRQMFILDWVSLISISAIELEGSDSVSREKEMNHTSSESLFDSAMVDLPSNSLRFLFRKGLVLE